jgi:hypothetical protein
VRTTLDIDDPLLERLKRLAERRQVSLGRLASELIARGMKEPPAGEEAAGGRFRWPPVALGQPRIPLDDKERLWAALDADAPAGAGQAAARVGKPRHGRPGR